MSATNKTALPKFLNYKEEDSNNGYETIMDFLLSWTIRCSVENLKEVDSSVYENSRILVYYLIYGQNKGEGYWIDEDPIPEDFIVIEVKTKRQIKGIDLLAEVVVHEYGLQKKYILNIEHKFYSSLEEHQLKEYRNIIEEKYKGQKIINLFISLGRDRKAYKREKDLCEESHYKILTIGDIVSYFKFKETGNVLFDTLWDEID